MTAPPPATVDPTGAADSPDTIVDPTSRPEPDPPDIAIDPPDGPEVTGGARNGGSVVTDPPVTTEPPPTGG